MSIPVLVSSSLSFSLGIPLRLARSLLEKDGLSLLQCVGLSVVDALEPVSEAGAAGRIDGVHPEGGLVEEGAHLNTHLPESGAEAFNFRYVSIPIVPFWLSIVRVLLSGGRINSSW